MLASPCIYLDYNATTPIDKEVADAMRPYLEFHFGNPSSAHPYGVTTKIAVENARKQLASALVCQTDEIIFTSGGSESNNHAIKVCISRVFYKINCQYRRDMFYNTETRGTTSLHQRLNIRL